MHSAAKNGYYTDPPRPKQGQIVVFRILSSMFLFLAEKLPALPAFVVTLYSSTRTATCSKCSAGGLSGEIKLLHESHE